jgi:hypothetical protein
MIPGAYSWFGLLWFGIFRYVSLMNTATVAGIYVVNMVGDLHHA